MIEFLLGGLFGIFIMALFQMGKDDKWKRNKWAL